MKINNNIQALNAYRNLNMNQFNTSKNLEKLSSGMRINRAADDAAGLAISEKMRSQIRGLKQAERNSMDGISLMQTAEGALQEVHAMLQRMRELAVQGANDTNTEYDREQIQKEIEQLKLEIDSVSEKTEFNTRKLLNGSSAVLSSISEAGDNGANVKGSPKVIDPRLVTGEYHLKVESTEEIVTMRQVGAGISISNDISLDADSAFFPQAFGEYTINIRSFLANQTDNGVQHSATIQIIGPNGLPLEERSVPVNSQGDIHSIGGLNIDTEKINEAGTVKVSIEQQATFSVYRGAEPTEGNKIAAEKTMITRNGVIRHGGVEFNFDNNISTAGGKSVGTLTNVASTPVDPGNPVGAVTFNVAEQSAIAGTGAIDNISLTNSVEAVAVEWALGNFSVLSSGETGSFEFNGVVVTINGSDSGSNSITAQASGTMTLSINTSGTTASGQISQIATLLNGYSGGSQFDTVTFSVSGAALKITGPENTTLNGAQVTTTGAIQFNGTNLSGLSVTTSGVATVLGVVEFDISENFTVGSQIELDFSPSGVNLGTFTGVSGTPGPGEFQVGATPEATAANLAAAITAADSGNVFNVAVSGAKITMTESVATGVQYSTDTLLDSSAVTPRPEVPGEYTFVISNNFVPGEQIVIGGQTLTFTDDAAAAGIAAGTHVEIGATLSGTAGNLLGAITTHAILSTRYEDNGSSGANVSIKEINGQVTGTDLDAPIIFGADATPGSVTFEIETPLAVGDLLEVGGVTFEVVEEGELATSGNVAIELTENMTADAQAQIIRDYFNTGGDGAGVFTVAGNDAVITLTQSTVGTGNIEAPNLSGPIASTKFSITNNALAFQIGPNTNQNVMIDVPRLDIVTLGIEEIDVTTQKGANEAIFALDQAINTLSDVRAKLGATQNRMEHTINNLQVTHENLTASESRIRDADMALEMTTFTKNNILNQAATAMLAQANQLPQGVLQLLQ